MANVLSLVISTLAVIATTRMMSQNELGTAATFLANRNTLDIVVTLAIYSYVNKGLVSHEDDETNFVASLTAFCAVSILFFFLIAFPFKSLIQNLLSLDDFLFYWLFPSLLSYSLFLIANYYCIYTNQTGLVFWMVMATGPISQILSIALIACMPNCTHIGRVIGLDSAYVIIAAILLIYLIRKRKGINCRCFLAYAKESLLFTIPLIPHLLSQMVITQFDLTLISNLAGADKSGIYSMGHTIGNLAFTMLSQIMCAWSPWVYRRLRDNNTALVKAGSKYLLLLGLWLSCGLITISPEMVHLLLPPDYYPTITIVPALVFSMYLQFLFLFEYDLEYYHKRTGWIAAGSSIAAGVNIALDIALIPVFGYQIACIATCISCLVLVGFNLIEARKIGFQKYYNLKAMVVTTICLAAFAVTSLVFEHSILVRYTSMVTLTVILYTIAKPFISMLIKNRRSHA